MKKLMTATVLGLLVAASSVAVMAKAVNIDLKSYLNSPGVAALGTEAKVGFDVDGESSWASYDSAFFPKGGGLIDGGVPGINYLVADPALELDNIECAGQVVAVTPDNYKALYILAGNHHGASEDAPIVLTYDDGKTETVTFSVTDWCQEPKFDEVPVLAMDHRVNLDGSEHTINCWIEGVSVKVNPAKKLKSISLPAVTDDFAAQKLHIFGMTLDK